MQTHKNKVRFFRAGFFRGKALFIFLVCSFILPVVVSGCLGVPSPTGQNPYTGSWVRAEKGCVERISLTTEGSFTYGIEIPLNGKGLWRSVGGQYTQWSENTDFLGEGVVFTPQQKPGENQLIYCDQWENISGFSLPNGQLAELAGVDLAGLNFHSEVLVGAGDFLVGTDIFRESQVIWELTPTGAAKGYLFSPPDGVAFYQAQTSDPNGMLNEVAGIKVINLPRGHFHRVFSAMSGGEILYKTVLNFSAATQVILSYQGREDLRPCNLSFYTNQWFTTIDSSYHYPSGTNVKVLNLNPLAPGSGVKALSVTNSAGVSAAAQLVFLGFTAPAAGDCVVTLDAKALALTEFLANKPSPVYETPWVNSSLLWGVLGGGGMRTSLAFQEGLAMLPRWDLRKEPLWFNYPPLRWSEGELAYDPLGLLSGGVEAGLHVDGETLLMFGSGGAMGGFTKVPDAPPGTPLSFPLATSGSWTEGEEKYRFEFSLENGERVIFRGEGISGVQLEGAEGEMLRKAWGNSVSEINFVQTLPPGNYFLEVFPPLTHSGYALQLGVSPAYPYPDDALATCLLNHTLASGVLPEQIDCSGYGIVSLEGISNHPEILGLILDGNFVSELLPLVALTSLRLLSLADNPISSVLPLKDLWKLERLSLAGLNLGPGEGENILQFSRFLSLLNLKGVTGLTEAEIQAIKIKFPVTALKTPDGGLL